MILQIEVMFVNFWLNLSIMKKNYTIKIIPNDTTKNQVAYSAYCKEWDIFAEHESIPKVLSSLFSAIEIMEEEQKETSLDVPKHEIEFSIPITV